VSTIKELYYEIFKIDEMAYCPNADVYCNS